MQLSKPPLHLLLLTNLLVMCRLKSPPLLEQWKKQLVPLLLGTQLPLLLLRELALLPPTDEAASTAALEETAFSVADLAALPSYSSCETNFTSGC